MIKRIPLRRDNVRVEFIVSETRLPSGRVSVVGDFNGWDPAALPLAKQDDGTRSASVVLKTGGRYAFRYDAEDARRWVDEETADSAEPNTSGTWNSIVLT